jgi:tripartite-type tricarboxylate transporter receptor subunit TctC
MLKTGRVLFLVLAGFLAFAANAQQYPNRPVRMIISQGAGGPTDLAGRLIAEYLGRNLGQNVIVENRVGDASMLGHRYAVQQPPDGYTILMTGDYAQLWPISAKSWDLDLVKDFTYVGTIVRVDSLILTSAQAPYKTFGEFMAYARANPGKTNYANISLSRPTIMLRYINKFFNLGMTEISYKSSAEAKLATLRGELNFYTDSAGTARDKTLQPLFFVGTLRNPRFPEVPTLADGELGKMGLSFGPSWHGIAGPARLPPEILAKLSAALLASLDSKEYNERSNAMGYVTTPSTPAELQSRVAVESAQWVKLAKELGLTPQ